MRALLGFNLLRQSFRVEGVRANGGRLTGMLVALLLSLCALPANAVAQPSNDVREAVRDEPVHAATLALFLAALAENCGAHLLRVKGIVGIREAPDTPAAIHGVQHVYHAPAWLPRWPSPDRRTRVVLIGRNIREVWTLGLLELLNAEVAEEIAQRAVGSPVA